MKTFETILMLNSNLFKLKDNYVSDLRDERFISLDILWISLTENDKYDKNVASFIQFDYESSYQEIHEKFYARKSRSFVPAKRSMRTFELLILYDLII